MCVERKRDRECVCREKEKEGVHVCRERKGDRGCLCIERDRERYRVEIKRV